MTYRKDIDGLRCLAIVAVLIFHAFPKALPGGFIGVDVFFVISGFLISRIIFNDLNKNKFSFAVFYARRFRRLLPALVLVLLSVWTLGYFLLLSDEMTHLGKHLMGAAGFVANIQLWKEAGYFDVQSNTKLLLHLWSLGVEEQFYLVWPMLLFLLSKQKKIRADVAILFFLFISLLLNISQIHYDTPSVFFGMFTRLWQFSFGAILAFHDQKWPSIKTIYSEILAFFGIGLIAYSCFALNESVKYPGWWAMLPTVGSTLLIMVGAKSKITKFFLANPIAVFVGLISYPLYLWHWPLLSFLHITEGSEITLSEIWTALGLSFILAYLTYKFIEKPIQRDVNLKSRLIVRRTIFVALTTLGLIVFLGFETYATGGFPKRLSRYGLDKINFVDPYEILTAKNKAFECPEGLKNQPILLCRQKKDTPPTIAVWGDSLSLAIQTGFESKNIFPLFISQGGCPPLADTKVVRGDEDLCKLSNRQVLNYIKTTPSIKTVILVSLGLPYLEGKRLNVKTNIQLVQDVKSQNNLTLAYSLGLERTASELLTRGKRVIIYRAHPNLPLTIQSVKECGNFRPFRFSKKPWPNCETNLQSFIAEQQTYWALLGHLKIKYPAIKIFKSDELFCDQKRCRAFAEGRALYSNTEHLSVDGGNYVVKNLLDYLKLTGN